MSFPNPYGGQFPGGENYSTPSTPHDAFPRWDTIEGEQQQEQQHQQQNPQQQQQTVIPSGLHSPIASGYPQTIQLEDPPVVPSQHDAEVRLHAVNQDPSTQSKNVQSQPLSSSSSMIIRPGRGQQHHQAQQQAHPYRRPSTSTSVTAGSSRQGQPPQHQISVFPVQQQVPTPREQHVHFAQPPAMVRRSSGGVVASAIPSSSSTRASPLVPSPTTRIASFGSSVSGSPVAGQPPLGSTLLRSSPRPMDPPPVPPSAQLSKPKSYIIRMDTHYDTDTHVLTAVLEVPGVKREHLSVRLSTCSYNRVRQITISGVVYPPAGFPPLINQAAAASTSEGVFTGVVGPKMSVRERRYGICQRVLPVPSDLKREDIEASLQDGVLTLRFPCGMPAEEDGEDVTIR
ncbi:hypothetical protein CC2G_004111 [Coprinopsis cinerea AmutBmut pab1-1]|nr:hypothetical protein CC2G_004111 [Coprinopsis cinerea AmutBmut pab1-1]